MKKNILFIFIISFLNSWDGYDYDTGNYIEVESGNLVRSGNEIEIYDYQTGEYKNVEVESIKDKELEVYDHETGEYRTFEMD
jgi:GTPase